MVFLPHRRLTDPLHFILSVSTTSFLRITTLVCIIHRKLITYLTYSQKLGVPFMVPTTLYGLMNSQKADQSKCSPHQHFLGSQYVHFCSWNHQKCAQNHQSWAVHITWIITWYPLHEISILIYLISQIGLNGRFMKVFKIYTLLVKNNRKALIIIFNPRLKSHC